MKVKMQIIDRSKEEQVQFQIHQITKNVTTLVDLVKQSENVLHGKEEDITYKVPYAEIYYIESVDKKTFLYTEERVLTLQYRLYELEELLDQRFFLRVSKSMIVNLRRIAQLTPTLSGRFEATLQNGEKISISRRYVKEMKAALGLTKGGK